MKEVTDHPEDTGDPRPRRRIHPIFGVIAVGVILYVVAGLTLTGRPPNPNTFKSAVTPTSAK